MADLSFFSFLKLISNLVILFVRYLASKVQHIVYGNRVIQTSALFEGFKVRIHLFKVVIVLLKELFWLITKLLDYGF